ncbi:lipopolysaccharide kinase InaA family protein, partial [Pseudomaricurvus sp.]|uniref:lipopolysaccharide kinase InaA family protein n=1 Tax=Pseudomaricurvus sp. TaxID=2004510 RepID=UPI003F6BA706
MKEYIAAEYLAAFRDCKLEGFDDLWALDLPTVDQPNTERGGWSSVCRFEIDVAGQSVGFYLKRQNNHCSYSWQRPFGEPTFAREFRNIRHYHELGLPAPEVAYFAERKSRVGKQAILMTRALDELCPLSD